MTAIRGYAAMIEEMDLPPDKRGECAHLVVEETDRLNGMIDEILEFTRGGPARLQRTSRAGGGAGGQAAAAPGAGPGQPRDPLRGRSRLHGPDRGGRGQDAARDAEHRHQRAGRDGAGRHLAGALARRPRAPRDRPQRTPAVASRRSCSPGIYEPFFTHGKARGIGLGMSITRKIVEEHGGRILLDSQVGRGTTFTVCLPIDATVGDGAGPRLGARASRGLTGSGRPMDNQSLARVLHDIADALEIKGESFFRIRSYRLSAESIASHGEDVAEMVRRGDDLRSIPGVGDKHRIQAARDRRDRPLRVPRRAADRGAARSAGPPEAARPRAEGRGPRVAGARRPVRRRTSRPPSPTAASARCPA